MPVKNHLSVFLQEEEAKAFLEALLNCSIAGIRRICRGEDLPEVFAPCGVYPDLYLEDLAGTRYVIKGIEADEGKLEWLGRALQSAVDAESMSHGGDLPDSYILFICDYDYYRAGLAIYEIQDSFGGIQVDNGCHTVILNSHYRNPNAAPQVIEFLDRVRD